MHPDVINCNLSTWNNDKSACYYMTWTHGYGICCGQVRRPKLCPYRKEKNNEVDNESIGASEDATI